MESFLTWGILQKRINLLLVRELIEGMYIIPLIPFIRFYELLRQSFQSHPQPSIESTWKMSKIIDAIWIPQTPLNLQHKLPNWKL